MHSRKPLGTVANAHATLGFRAHSGWAALVAVAGPARSPEVIDRRRIELADPEIPRPVQPYHAALKLDLKEAEVYVKHFADRARLLAKQAVRAAIGGLRERGYEVVGCGIPLGSGRPAPSVETALSSHPMLHTAEGELFRGALKNAGESCGLHVMGVKEKELIARGATELGFSLDDLRLRLAEMGRPVGPPWGQDQKLATLVAWLALAAYQRAHPRQNPGNRRGRVIL
jgi:hypothetical protein